MMTFTVDSFRLVFLAITLAVYVVSAACLPALSKVTKNNRRFLIFYALTFLSTIGIFLSADLFTTFCFFEVMTLTSFAYVGNDETSFSKKAALSYLAYGILGGLVMLFGVMLLYFRLGTLDYTKMSIIAETLQDKRDLYLASSCLLFGFGAKAGMYPLHTWLPKTYVAAPCAGTTVLSAVLSKAGIFGIYLVTKSLFPYDRNWGLALTVLGCLTMFTGGLLGLFSINIKRTLACSSMAQIGFILVAIGTQNSTGAMLHTINHSLFKLVLFTVVSMIYSMTGELDYNRLAGFANRKKWLQIPFLAAALGISGVPLFSGFISKTLIHETLSACAIGPNASLYHLAEYIFIVSGAMTFAYMLKLYFALFHNRTNSESCQPDTCIAKPELLSVVLLCLLSPLCIGFILWYPGLVQNVSAIAESGLSLGIGALIYFLIIHPFMTKEAVDSTASDVTYTAYPDIYPSWLDIEAMIYRPLMTKLLPFIGAFFSRVFDRIIDGISILLMKVILRPVGKSHVKEDHPLAYAVGKIADGILYIIQVKIRKKPPITHVSYSDLLAVGTTEFTRTTRLILYSVSFGLLMFALGLTAALIYLLVAIH